MTWRKSKAERRRLEQQVQVAREQLVRASKQEVRVKRLHDVLKVEVDQNHMGDRLKEHFRRSRRRPGNDLA